MKILYVTPNATDPLAFYRGTGPLRRLGIHLTIADSVSWATIAIHDLVYFQRPFNPQHIEILNMCQKWGVPTLADFDDWLYDLMPDNPAYSVYSKAKDNLEKVRLSAGKISVSTEHMRRLYAGLGTDATVLPNAYDSELFTPSDATDRRKIVLWRGGGSHTQDLISVRQGWVELIAKHKDWQFVFMNCYPWWLGEIADNVKFIDGLGVIEYMEAIQKIQPAIMTHPLLDSDFNRCKSMCSYIEAAHAGAAFVGPDFEEFNRPGLVRYKPNCPESFFTEINSLIEKPENIVANALTAQKEILGPLSLREVNKKRLELFKQCVL